MEILQLPKPITWDTLKETCMKNLDSLFYLRKEFAMQGLLELEREMNTRFPGMTSNPWVVKADDWQKARKNYGKLRAAINKDKKNVAEICRDALIRIDSILDLLANTDYELKDVNDNSNLSRLQVLVCFHHWLVKNKWKHKPLVFGYKNPEQITAYKKDKKMIARFLGQYGYIGNHFEKDLGFEMLGLFKIKNKNPDAHVVMAIADGKESRSVLNQYVPYILKTGIRIFMVKAPGVVEELKNKQ